MDGENHEYSFSNIKQKTEMLMAPSVKYLLKALWFSYTPLINNKKVDETTLGDFSK